MTWRNNYKLVNLYPTERNRETKKFFEQEASKTSMYGSIAPDM